MQRLKCRSVASSGRTWKSWALPSSCHELGRSHRWDVHLACVCSADYGAKATQVERVQRADVATRQPRSTHQAPTLTEHTGDCGLVSHGGASGRLTDHLAARGTSIGRSRTLAWQGKSIGEICRQLKDPKANGGRDLAMLHEHVAKDDLVAWGWNPGTGRAPAPGTQEIAGQLIQAWINTGAQCP